ncbi:hypothetical protein [Nitrosopumilus sp.]|uniref:hypothetical protein n=1 Tax=Nitrosopumilus sp. TaxID=2024843 RepID=UPI003D0B9A32
MILDKPTRIQKIHQAFINKFSDGMMSIKPEKTDPKYAKKIESWQLAFDFPQRLNLYVVDLANTIVLAGKYNQNIPENDVKVTRDFTDDVLSVLHSDKFDHHMEIAKPDIPDDQHYDEKIKKWSTAFNFVKVLRDWAKDVEKEIDDKGGEISYARYNTLIYTLILNFERT